MENSAGVYLFLPKHQWWLFFCLGSREDSHHGVQDAGLGPVRPPCCHGAHGLDKTIQSSNNLSILPSKNPIVLSSNHPTILSFNHPNILPSTLQPFNHPTILTSTLQPSNHPIIQPNIKPSYYPTIQPSHHPTKHYFIKRIPNQPKSTKKKQLYALKYFSSIRHRLFLYSYNIHKQIFNYLFYFYP